MYSLPKKRLFFIIFISLLVFSVTYANVFKGPQKGITKLKGLVFINELPQGISYQNKIRKSIPIGNLPVTPITDVMQNEQIVPFAGTASPEEDQSNNISKSTVTDQLTANFEGIKQTALYPPDPVIASGLDKIIVAVNSAFAIYNKNGNKISQTDFSVFFNNHTDNLFDPKVVYDQYDQRWVMLVLAENDADSTSHYLIAVSQTSDPTGSWYKYASNARMNGTTDSKLWADYPGLGYDDDAVYVTSNQYTFTTETGDFQYAKLRIFKKSELYYGSTLHFNDFWNMKNFNNSTVFTLKPAHHFGTTASAYLLNTKWYSGSSLTLWRVDNPTNSPTLIRQADISVSNYYSPPNAKQKGSTKLISVKRTGTRTQDVVFRDGKIYTSFQTAHNWGSGSVSAIRYVKINISNNSADIDAVYGADNIYYYNPSIYVDAYNDIFLVFNRSNSSEYPGVRWTYRTPTDSEARESQSLKNGASAYTPDTYTVERWGDYSGICLDAASDNQIWFYSEWAKSNDDWATQVGSFRFAPVQFTNLNENNSNMGGNILLNSVLSISSGITVGFQPNSTNTAKTLASGDVSSPSDRFGSIKHNRWNNEAADYILSNDFTAQDAANQTQKAYFKQLEPATVTISTIENLPLGDNTLSFNDLWYLNSSGAQGNNFASHVVPLNETNVMTGAYNQSSGGVFLDQGYDPVNHSWNPPYYSVKAEASKNFIAHGQNITGYFLGWDGTDVDFQSPNNEQTPVVFHANNAEARAVYKGHLVSSQSRPTGYNNGRRIARDDNGELHMVYEDNGEIWYTYSTNDGNSWHKEVRLSDGTGNNHYPSIAIGNQNKYHVVWFEFYSSFYKEIVYKKEGQGAVSLGATSKSVARPAVAANRLFDFVMVAWNDGSSLKYKVYTDEWEEWSSLNSVPNTNSSCIYPAIANDGSSSYATHLAWQKNNDIYYQNMHYLLEEDFIWRHYKCVSNVQSLNENEYPSIAVRKIDRKPVIVWQSFDASNEEIDKLIVYRKKSSTSNSNWGTISEFSVMDRESLMPAVATYLNDNYNDATIVWHTDNKKLMKVNKHNGSWQNITQIASDSRYANISYRYNGNNNTTYDNILTWTKYHTSPYFVKTEEAGNSVLGKSSSSSNSEISRSEEFKLDLFVDVKASVTDNLGTFLFDLNYPESAYPVTFESVNDTLISQSFFRSGNFAADDFIKLPYQIFVNNVNQKSLEKYLKSFPSYLLKIVLRESNSGSVIETLVTITIDDLYDAILKGDKSISEVVYITPSKYPGSKVYLDVLTNVTRSKEYEPTRIVSYGNNIKDISEEVAKKSSSKPSELVRSYNLSTNYPNPFNPQTTITYDIPKDDHVKLVVYNVEGKIVATLVNGFKPKGRYLVVFNGESLSSGMYFYRMESGKYTSVKRMLLLK